MSEECAICGTDLAPPETPSFSLVEWQPETESNVLIAMYCPKHRPAADICPTPGCKGDVLAVIGDE